MNMKIFHAMSKKQKIIYGVSVLLSIAVIFYLGDFYGKSGAVGSINNSRGQFATGMFGGANRGASPRGGAGATVGEIISKDNQSITLKVMSGCSKIIFTPSSATVQKMVVSSLADLSVGMSVIVQGGTNSDGSVTAQSIQIR